MGENEFFKHREGLPADEQLAFNENDPSETALAHKTWAQRLASHVHTLYCQHAVAPLQVPPMSQGYPEYYAVVTVSVTDNTVVSLSSPTENYLPTNYIRNYPDGPNVMVGSKTRSAVEQNLARAGR
jgi:hypothetical protein